MYLQSENGSMSVIRWRVGFAGAPPNLEGREIKFFDGFLITSMRFAGYCVFTIKIKCKVTNTNVIEHT